MLSGVWTPLSFGYGRYRCLAGFAPPLALILCVLPGKPSLVSPCCYLSTNCASSYLPVLARIGAFAGFFCIAAVHLLR
jgi:hypothetical protein